MKQTFTMDTQTGRMALAPLAFQDVWAIVVLAGQPNRDDPQVLPIASALAASLVAAGSLIVAHWVLPIGGPYVMS